MIRKSIGTFVLTILLAALAVGLFPKPGLAVIPREVVDCNKLSIKDCTAVIETFRGRGGHDARGIRAFAYWKRAAAYIERGEQGDIDRARADLDEALRNDPESAWAHEYRGFLLLQNGKYDLAIADFNEAIRIEPKFRLALAMRGARLAAKG